MYILLTKNIKYLFIKYKFSMLTKINFINFKIYWYTTAVIQVIFLFLRTKWINYKKVYLITVN